MLNPDPTPMGRNVAATARPLLVPLRDCNHGALTPLPFTCSVGLELCLMDTPVFRRPHSLFM